MIKQVFQIENHFNSIIEFKKFHPNFNNSDYTELVFDNSGKLIEADREKFVYDDFNRLKSIICVSNGNLIEDSNTYKIDFEYFDKEILKKTILVKSESFFSANDVRYTTNGLNTFKDIPKFKNELVNTEKLSIDVIENIVNRKLYFNDQLDYNIFKLKKEPNELIFKDESSVIFENKIKTKFNNTIVQKRTYLKHFNSKNLLLAEIDIKLKYRDGAEYGCNYDTNGNIIEYSDSKEFTPDSEAEYFDIRQGIYRFGYNEECKINYYENPSEIATVSREYINDCKIEIGTIIDKIKQKVKPWYKLYEFKTTANTV